MINSVKFKYQIEYLIDNDTYHYLDIMSFGCYKSVVLKEKNILQLFI